jgi:hypothetical protein
MAGMDAPEVSECEPIDFPLPPESPYIYPPLLPEKPKTNHSLRSCGSLAAPGIAFWSVGTTVRRRGARMAKRERRGPPDQVPAPQARPVQPRRRPSAPPTRSTPALAVEVDTARRRRRRRHRAHA